MPKVASASALRPMATRTALIAITAVQALWRTMKTKLVAVTIHVRLLGELAGNGGAKVGGLVCEAIRLNGIDATRPLSRRRVI